MWLGVKKKEKKRQHPPNSKFSNVSERRAREERAGLRHAAAAVRRSSHKRKTQFKAQLIWPRYKYFLKSAESQRRNKFKRRWRRRRRSSIVPPPRARLTSMLFAGDANSRRRLASSVSKHIKVAWEKKNKTSGPCKGTAARRGRHVWHLKVY